MTNTSYVLELKHITKKFGTLVAINDVSMSIKSGEHRAVLGSNGAGKTTLFNAITGDFLATSGDIFFFGENITNLPVHERIHNGLRRTYQKSLLFGGLSVFDNLYLSVCGIKNNRFNMRPENQDSKDISREQARDLASFSHLDDVLLKNVDTLSYGQQRQLEIGMAMAGAPRLLLFDEPAAGLSPAERSELANILMALPSHVTFIIIEHDLEIALKVSDIVSVMYNGSLFKEGSPAEIQNDKEVQAIYLGEE